MRVLSRFVLMVPIFFSACIFQNISPTEKLRDAVIGYNDAYRWNRLDLAVLMVDPPLRPKFRAEHHRWGKDIQIADSEILQVQVAGKEHATAVATVAYHWYDQRGMVIAETVVLQRYEKRKGGYAVIGEEVISGDARLLEVPEGFEFELPTEDDEASPAVERDEYAVRGEAH